MKKTILATVVLATLVSPFAMAQEKTEEKKPDSAVNAPSAAEKKPDHEVSFNIGVASDYRYRGISQTSLDPALQGGADYTHNPTGLYAGTWLSTIKWIKDAGDIYGYNGKGEVEVDLYAGKKGDIGGGFSYDVGGLYYWYPDNNYSRIGENADTFELYGKISYGPAYVKYSHALTDTFGNPNSKDSSYLDVGADVDLGSGYTLNLHAGHQKIKGSAAADYNDWKLGVSKEFFTVNFSLAYIGTDADEDFYVTPSGKFTGKDALVLTATKTF